MYHNSNIRYHSHVPLPVITESTAVYFVPIPRIKYEAHRRIDGKGNIEGSACSEEGISKDI